MCARLEIRTGRLAHTRVYYVASRRARAVRAKCSLAGLTTRVAAKQLNKAKASKAPLVAARGAREGLCSVLCSGQSNLRERTRSERADNRLNNPVEARAQPCALMSKAKCKARARCEPFQKHFR